MRAAPVEGQQLRLVKIAAVGKGRVHGGAGVALRADQPVAAGHFGIRGVDVHLFKIEHGQQLHHRQAAADMPDAEMTDGGHDIAADILADFFDVLHAVSSDTFNIAAPKNLEFLGSNFVMFRGCPVRGERNGNQIFIDVSGKCCVLVQD